VPLGGQEAVLADRRAHPAASRTAATSTILRGSRATVAATRRATARC